MRQFLLHELIIETAIVRILEARIIHCTAEYLEVAVVSITYSTKGIAGTTEMLHYQAVAHLKAVVETIEYVIVAAIASVTISIECKVLKACVTIDTHVVFTTSAHRYLGFIAVIITLVFTRDGHILPHITIIPVVIIRLRIVSTM